MKNAFHLVLLAILFIAPQKEQVWTADIDQIRHVSRMIPGMAPVTVGYFSAGLQ